MPRLALLHALGVCLFACAPRPEPAALHTVEVEKPGLEAARFEPPVAKAVPVREEAPAPVPTVVGPVESWAKVTLERERSGFPWARAVHTLKGHLELPRSGMSEPMVMGPVVVVTPEGVYFTGRRMARIEFGLILDLDSKGPLIVALKEPLQQAVEASAVEAARLPGPMLRTVALFADAATPFGILVNVIYTAGKSGATDYQIAVQGPDRPMKRGTDVLHVSPPKFVKGQTDDERDAVEKLQMIMEVSPTDVRIGRHVPRDPARSAWLERVSVEGDREAAMKKISALARAMIAEEQWDVSDMPTVRFSADPYVSLELLVAALAAAGGSDCDILDLGAGSRGRCLFTRRVVYGGSAAPSVLAGR